MVKAHLLQSQRRQLQGAAEYGVTATLRCYTEKYQDLPLTETSMQMFKDLTIVKNNLNLAKLLQMTTMLTSWSK